MNKSELIAALSEETDLNKAQSERAVNAFTKIVTECVAKGEEVALVGFGTFSRKERAARAGINPQTKEPIQIAASKVPAFKSGKAFKDACNFVEEAVN